MHLCWSMRPRWRMSWRRKLWRSATGEEANLSVNCSGAFSVDPTSCFTARPRRPSGSAWRWTPTSSCWTTSASATPRSRSSAKTSPTEWACPSTTWGWGRHIVLTRQKPSLTKDLCSSRSASETSKSSPNWSPLWRRSSPRTSARWRSGGRGGSWGIPEGAGARPPASRERPEAPRTAEAPREASRRRRRTPRGWRAADPYSRSEKSRWI